jgi:hypothetical protein
MLIYVIIYLFAFLHTSLSSRDSSVGIVMGYGLEGRRLDRGRSKIFFLSTASIPALGPTQSPGGGNSLGTKRGGGA